MMSITRVTGRRALILGALTVCLGIAIFGSQIASSSAHSAKAGTAEIDMKLQGKRLFFDGPDTVAAGSKLKIVNKTNCAARRAWTPSTRSWRGSWRR